MVAPVAAVTCLVTSKFTEVAYNPVSIDTGYVCDYEYSDTSRMTEYQCDSTKISSNKCPPC